MNALTLPQPINPKLLGSIFVLLSAIGFSAKAILVKLAYVYSVDAITLLALRMVFSAPFFIITAIWYSLDKKLSPLTRTDWLTVLVLGFLGYYLASLLDFLGLQFISAGLERLILFLYPTFVVVLSVLFFSRPLRKKELFALLLSYVGIAIVFQHDIDTVQQNLILGSSLVFASAWAYALYLIGSGRSIARLGAMRFMSYVMIVACVACFAQFLFTRPLNSVFSQAMPVYGLGIAMALLSTVAPAFLLALGIRHIGASRASLISSIGPITTIFLAYFFLNEPMSAVQLFGSALVLAGVLLVSL